MRYLKGCASILAFAFLLFLSTGNAHAQATRTWVSGVGDDVNPCSRTAPCKTFPGAISKTATGGEINCLDPGGFGTVTITKSITLDCTGTMGSILNTGVNGVIINAAGGKVVLRDIEINGAGSGSNGIRILSAASVTIDNVRIYGQSGLGIDAEPTSAGTTQVSVINSVLSENAGGAILFKPAAGVNLHGSLTRVGMFHNLYGMRVEDRTKATVFDSVANENSNNGFLAVGVSTAAEIDLAHSVSANNGTNGVATNGASGIVRIAYMTLYNNTTNINTGGGGTVFSFTPATNANAGAGTPGAPNGAAVPLQ